MRVNVIGGSGFIGTRLVHRLQKSGKYTVRIFDKAISAAFPALCQQGDVRSPTAVQAALADSDIVVNLAAEHRDNVQPASLYDSVNVDGARNIVAAARSGGIKSIVFTSSVAVYGFADIGTNEEGTIAPFNDYGRTKFEAENVFLEWQRESPKDRALVIIRPTVVFGEQNRGNVYNLLRQIASGRFLMIGHGRNRKSIAYVENVAAFIEHAIGLAPGVHTINYVDQPDFTMNDLVLTVHRTLGRPAKIGPRLPLWAGLTAGKLFDFVAMFSGRQFAISSIRVKKFSIDSVYNSAAAATGFVPPVPLLQALEKTIRHEFVEKHAGEALFYSE